MRWSRGWSAVALVTLCLLPAAYAWAHGGHGGGGGGHGGGGHGGGGHGGSGHYGGGGGHYSGGYSGGMHSGGSISHSPSMGHVVSPSMGGVHSGTINSGNGLSASGAMHSGAIHSGNAQHHVSSGSSAHHSPQFMQKHLASSQTGQHAGAHQLANNNANAGGNNLGHHHGGNGGNGNGGNGHQHHHHSYWRNSYFFGFGSPFGYYLGYPWYGYNYWRNRYYPWGGYGYGYGVPYYYGYQADCAYAGNFAYPTDGTVLPVAAADPTLAAQTPEPTTDQLSNSLDFAGQGEQEFKAGKYQAAVQNWRHALVDDPRNGAIVLLLGQALFAVGRYDEAAGATQQALRMLPQDKWGVVVSNYKELYGNMQDYTDQLRALEKARDSKPDDPAVRMLLGYHFGYLGYPKQSVRELNKTLELAPKDEVSTKLLDIMKAKLPSTDDKPAEPPAKQPDKSAGAKPVGTPA